MVKIVVDGKTYEANPEKNLLENCLAHGINIPHFCYHAALGSVGACRLCAVKKFRDKDDTRGRIVMSCMEPVVEGLIVSVEDSDARTFRASVIESLMTNHPHDCPVCDEGGECHLQDMTIMSGHTYRKFDFPKRTYKDQDQGPFIAHEMNRCIQCYRCVRFYSDYAGGKDLKVFASRNHVYFGRHEDGPLENEFSGNLVEVCPTGVFTDKTLKRHFIRKWDLSNSPSVCVHCSVGCNIIASERYGSLRRIMSRYNGAVNGYFICDRGRFGYEFVNDGKRIRNAEIRTNKEADLQHADAEKLTSFLNQSINNSVNILGIGSPRATLESNFALLKFVGKDNFFHGISQKEHRMTKVISEYLQKSSVHTPSLKEIEKADVVLVLGEDLINTAPMIALAVRQAARNVPNEEAKKNHIPLWNDIPVRQLGQNQISPIFIATPFEDSLDEIAEKKFRASYEEIADMAAGIASGFDEKAPKINTGNNHFKEFQEGILQSFKNAKNPLIISGISSGNEAIVNAALNLATAMKSAGVKIMLTMVVPECNSIGLSFFPGKSFEEIMSSKGDSVIILENDLYRRADKTYVDDLLNNSKQVIVIDQLGNATTDNSDILLPAATFSESEGTIVSNEGRAQRYYKAVINKDQVKESWRWLDDFIKIKEASNTNLWNKLDDVIGALVKELPFFAKLKKYMPDADFRMLNAKIPRQTMRYSGRTAMTANISVSEPKLAEDKDSPLAFSMEGLPEKPPSSLVPFYWTPGWNSVQAMYNYVDEPDGSLKGGDPGIKLFESDENVTVSYIKQESRASKPTADEMLIVPKYQIFGSEELSSSSKSVMQKISEPFVLLNQKDADNLSVKDDDHLQLAIRDTRIDVKVKIGSDIGQGIAALSVSLKGMPYIELPGSGKFHKL